MNALRRPWLAVLLSFLASGLGQLYAGRLTAAVAVAVAMQAGVWLVVILWTFLPPSVFTLLFGFLGLLTLGVGNLVHAGVVAHRSGPEFEPRPYNRWYVYVAAFGVLTLWQQGSFAVAKNTLAEAFQIPSFAMAPTLLRGDYLFVAKSPRSLLAPEHEAIVVFLSVEDSTPGLHLVKRVIGMPGDTLQMVRDSVYRNGGLLDEPYAVRGGDVPDDAFRLPRIRAWQVEHYVGRDPASYRPTTHDWGPIVVPSEHWFALGDNRAESYDSRYYGFVPFANIRGRPRLLYFSYDREVGAVRWGRIGRGVQ